MLTGRGLIVLALIVLVIGGAWMFIGGDGAANNEASAHRHHAVPADVSTGDEHEGHDQADELDEDDGGPWVPVGEYAGVGMDNTGEFTIRANAWRAKLYWESTETQPMPVMAFLRFQGDDPESPFDHGQFFGSRDETVTAEFDEAGTYFFHVHASDSRWRMVIEREQ